MNSDTERLWRIIETVRSTPHESDMQLRKTTMEDTISSSIISKNCASKEALSQLLATNKGLRQWLHRMTDEEVVFTLWLAWPKFQKTS